MTATTGTSDTATSDSGTSGSGTSGSGTSDSEASGTAASDPAILCDRLVRIYKTGPLEVQALQGLDLRVARGEIVAVVGASGSGKSTLLNILSGLDAPSAGSVRVSGQELTGMSDRDRLRYRRRTVGFIWQRPSSNLLPHLTAAENVALPMRYAGTGPRARRARALELLGSVGLGDRNDHLPARLSGGEQQRVAIAVALATGPSVLLADEPTGELDSRTADGVYGALRAANTDHGATVLIVTHDPAIAAQVPRTVAIRDGRVSSETLRAGRIVEDGEDGASRTGLGPAVEYIVVDKAGRLQLPREFIEPLGISERVRVLREPDHIEVWPYRDGMETEQPSDERAGD